MDPQWSTIIQTTTANQSVVPGFHIEAEIKADEVCSRSSSVQDWSTIKTGISNRAKVLYTFHYNNK